MACFVAPTAAAMLTRSLKKRIPSKYHSEWLLTMLWGGVAYLVVEHIYHGELVLYPPFFTRSISQIIPEILQVGVPMVFATFGVWALMVKLAAFRLYQLRFAPVALSMYGIVIMIVIDRIFS